MTSLSIFHRKKKSNKKVEDDFKKTLEYSAIFSVNHQKPELYHTTVEDCLRLLELRRSDR